MIISGFLQNDAIGFHQFFPSSSTIKLHKSSLCLNICFGKTSDVGKKIQYILYVRVSHAFQYMRHDYLKVNFSEKTSLCIFKVFCLVNAKKQEMVKSGIENFQTKQN